MMRSKSHALTALASFPIALDKRERQHTKEMVHAKHIRLILALVPDEVFVKVGVGIKLLGEETGLALLGHGVLFSSRQIKNQVRNDEGLRRLVEPGDVFLAEAREVNGVDLFGTVRVRNRLVNRHSGLHDTHIIFKPKVICRVRLID